MPEASPYLTASLTRFTDRGALIRRDVELMLEGLEVKGHLLRDLREKVQTHRQEDVAQLNEARRQTWAIWEERLKRIEEWMTSSSTLERSAGNLRAWRESVLGLGRAQSLARKYAASLLAKAGKIENRLAERARRTQEWASLLRAKEAELREFVERQAARDTEVLVSKARKQPYLDFVYLKREEEGRLSIELKSIRATLNRALDRIGRAEKWIARMAEANPAQFEMRKNDLLATWRPYHKRFSDLREAALHQAMEFEEGRMRLRWIYEQVQRMRVVESSASTRRPLLERLFGSREEN